MEKGFRLSFIHSIMPALSFGALTGILTSVMVNLYKVCAKYVISLSEKGYHFMADHLWYVPLAILLFLVIAFLFAYVYKRIPNLRGGGIPTSIGILRGIIPFKWVRNLVGIFSMSLVSFLVGVPLGNEGPSVQMGTAIGRGSVFSFGKKFRAWDRYSMTGGACAGFSAATGAPISGVIFSVEEAHQRISPMILMIATVSVMFSSMTTELLAPVLGVSKTLFPALQLPKLTMRDVWIPFVIGIVMGLFAVAFLSYYRLIFNFFNKKLKKIHHRWKILFVLCITFGMGLCSYSFISTGHELILHLFSHRSAIWWVLILLVVRATLTLCANTNRITGGIFLPLLAVGTLVSVLVGNTAIWLFGLDASYYTVILALGIVACIAGMMKMPLTAIVFAAEALSLYDNIVYVIVVAGFAFLITEIFGVESINDRVLENRVEEINEGKSAAVLDRYLTVRNGAFAVGMHVRDIFWPNGTFVLAHTHTVPVDKRDKNAVKALHASDILHVRCTTFDEEQTKQELQAILGDQEFRLE